jgi:hypothetical protein
MNTIGTRVASGVTGSVNGFSKPGQTNERKKQDDETVITTCSAKTVKWSNVSKSSMAARHPNGQNLYGSIEAFVRDQGRSLLILLQASVNHARLVDLARSVIRPRLVENLSDEELIQQISAAVRNASRALPVVPEEIPVVARVGSGENSGISSVTMHQAEGNDAVGLEIRSVGTFSIASAQSASEDNVIAARQLLAAEPISTSSSECQNSQANSSRGESHALSQQQRPQNEDQTDEAEDERKQPAQKKPRVDE